jgi:hypothetical protein
MAPTDLQLELNALGRLQPELRVLGGLLKMAASNASAGTPVDAESDMPSLVAARSVSDQTIPAVQTLLADRFIEVGDLVEQARTQFARADDDRAAVITSAGSLLPTAAPRG